MDPARSIADPRRAATAFADARFADASLVLLAGSTVRGEATPTSDLDLVLIGPLADAPYRESFRAFGWPIEAFVYRAEGYRDRFAMDVARRRPSLPGMCAEGVVLRDRDGLAERVRREARELLAAGPPPLSARELASARYRLTDLLMDLEGAAGYEERVFIATALVPALADLACDLAGAWRGEGKWIPTALHASDPATAERFVRAATALFAQGRREGLTEVADAVLEPVGGRLFEGFSSGKDGGRRADADEAESAAGNAASGRS